MVSILSLISNSSSFLLQAFATVWSVSASLGITVTLIFHCVVCSQAKSMYLFIFLLSFIFTLWSAGTAKSHRRLVLSIYLSIYLSCDFSFYFSLSLSLFLSLFRPISFYFSLSLSISLFIPLFHSISLSLCCYFFLFRFSLSFSLFLSIYLSLYVSFYLCLFLSPSLSLSLSLSLSQISTRSVRLVEVWWSIYISKCQRVLFSRADFSLYTLRPW